MPTKKQSSGKSKTILKNKMKKVMHEFKRGTLKGGKGKHPKVTSRKQAIAIGLSEARKRGAKVPSK